MTTHTGLLIVSLNSSLTFFFTRSLLTLNFLFHPSLCLPPSLSTDSAKIYLLYEILSQYCIQTFFLLYVLLIHLRSAINLCLYREEQSLMNRHGLWMGPFPEEEVITGYRVATGKVASCMQSFDSYLAT